MAGGTLMQRTTFLSGQRLTPAARLPRSHSARVPLPVVQAAAAATKRLKAGSGKKKPPARKVPNMQKGTQRIGGGTKPFGKGGTLRIGSQPVKKLISIANNSKERKFRQRADDLPTPKLLARVEQLRLLSKLEELKLLSLLQNNGITLTFIEKSGLLETAENLGLLSAAVDRNTPGKLFAAAFALFALAPAAVYFLPDNSNGLIAAQVALVTLGALGGSAAFAGGQLLSTLQKEVA
jgi:hypothetical protein